MDRLKIDYFQWKEQTCAAVLVCMYACCLLGDLLCTRKTVMDG